MPNQVSTGFGTVKSAPIRNNRSTIVMGGNVTGTEINAPNLETQLSQQTFYGAKLAAAVSPGSSGNTGTTMPLPSAPFGYSNPGFIMIRNNRVNIANSGSEPGNTLLQTGGSDVSGRRAIGRFYSYTRNNPVTFNIFPGGSGKITFGSQAGVELLASGINGVTGFYADTSSPRTVTGSPSHLTFMAGSLIPSGARYSTPTQP
jgi:hypothetical protein